MRYKGKKVVLIVILILAALIGLMSAYGASCPAWNPERLLIPDEETGLVGLSSYRMWITITNNLMVFQIMNILTYVAGGLTILCIVALFARWKIFYWLTVFTATLGVVSGITPYLLVKLGGASTPSYMRTILFGIVLILMVLPPFFKTFGAKNIANTRKVKGDASIAAAALFFPGVLVAIQSLIVGPSHMMPAANLYMSYGMIEAIQIGLGALLIAFGILVFALSKLRHRK